jgi:opacity protein-like surface antigen
MRRLLSLCALVTALAAGCGSTDGSTPVACLEGAGAYLRALEDTPGAVKLQGDTPISSCLAENQAGGALATVGTAMLGAATELNAEAREDPGGGANVQLGYLLGAAQRGADGTQGIHAELLRRLAAAARYSPDNRPLPATFLDAYQRGFDAGRTGG